MHSSTDAIHNIASQLGAFTRKNSFSPISLSSASRNRRRGIAERKSGGRLKEDSATVRIQRHSKPLAEPLTLYLYGFLVPLKLFAMGGLVRISTTLLLVCSILAPRFVVCQEPQSKPEAQTQPQEQIQTYDNRETFEASAYAGIGVDSFAADDLKKYLNPNDSSNIQERFIAGFDFAYRVSGDPKITNKQLDRKSVV